MLKVDDDKRLSLSFLLPERFTTFFPLSAFGSAFYPSHGFFIPMKFDISNERVCCCECSSFSSVCLQPSVSKKKKNVKKGENDRDEYRTWNDTIEQRQKYKKYNTIVVYSRAVSKDCNVVIYNNADWQGYAAFLKHRALGWCLFLNIMKHFQSCPCV